MYCEYPCEYSEHPCAAREADAREPGRPAVRDVLRVPCESSEYPVSTASTPVSIQSTPVQRARRMLENLVDRQYVMFIFDKRSRDLYGRWIQQCV